ncbi:MAG: hypothetical protein KDK37_15930 [Leptospiraceae bacterium]|nr:hypothetical protein [Leptospiraceae bacterium]
MKNGSPPRQRIATTDGVAGIDLSDEKIYLLVSAAYFETKHTTMPSKNVTKIAIEFSPPRIKFLYENDCAVNHLHLDESVESHKRLLDGIRAGYPELCI